jgi:cell division protease FtsH
VLDDVSSGAESDLKKATDLAFRMIAHFGMSERIGPVCHERRGEHPFLGQTLATEGGTSDATVRAIEGETQEVLNAAVVEARALIERHRSALDALIAVLLEHETVEGDELTRVLGPAVTAPHALPAEPLDESPNAAQ